ncbi:uncharacterized protein LOC111902865 [Lactuca sativa]|uniref:uncharacterized protein LOC111902865 n=1 Tax=Lactuca sativa TaxID=4236 RepID=UPI000CD7FABE|nr:uncharacterized protein LOC111902865 [Lactuca sativa]
MEVAIVDDPMISTFDVYYDYVLEIFGVGFLIDLILILMRDVCVITFMDMLIHFKALIDYEHQFVVVRTLSGGESTIYGDDTRVGSAFCLVARSRKYLQHGFSTYLAYVVDTQVKGKSISNDPMVREFLDVFPQDLPGVPPEKQVDFRIDLILGDPPIAKATYHLAPPKM